MRSNLFGTNLESESAERFTLQNPRMLKVALDGEVMARQGAMVAYQGRSTSPTRARAAWGSSSRRPSPVRACR